MLGSSSTFTCTQYFPYFFHLLHSYKEVHAQVVRTIRNHGEKKSLGSFGLQIAFFTGTVVH